MLIMPKDAGLWICRMLGVCFVAVFITEIEWNKKARIPKRPEPNRALAKIFQGRRGTS